MTLEQLLTRADLLELEPEELLATAECHGLDTEGLTPDQVFTELADLLEGFAAMAAEGS